MVTAFVNVEVKDFAEWKKIFDSDEPRRANIGVKLISLYTSLKNPNDVTMVFDIPNAELYDKMMGDPKRQEDIKRAGVISKPVATFFNKV